MGMRHQSRTSEQKHKQNAKEPFLPDRMLHGFVPFPIIQAIALICRQPMAPSIVTLLLKIYNYIHSYFTFAEFPREWYNSLVEEANT